MILPIRIVNDIIYKEERKLMILKMSQILKKKSLNIKNAENYYSQD